MQYYLDYIAIVRDPLHLSSKNLLEIQKAAVTPALATAASSFSNLLLSAVTGYLLSIVVYLVLL